MIPLPFGRTYCIIPGKLMGGCYPGDLDPQESARKLRGLVSCGISRIINLMEEDELDHAGRPFIPYQEDLQSIARAQGLPLSCARCPIRDGSVASREQMRAILDDIDASIEAGAVVYLHCWGGVGRTGTVAACYLARHGLAGSREVLAFLADLRREVRPYREAPENEDQRIFA